MRQIAISTAAMSTVKTHSNVPPILRESKRSLVKIPERGAGKGGKSESESERESARERGSESERKIERARPQ